MQTGLVYRSVLKPALDMISSSVLLIGLAPFIIFVSFLIGFHQRTWPFFVQQRAGRWGEPFKILKFKTMRDDREHEDNPHYDEIRLTKLGRWLRATSLDELPQLVNIFYGHMSLVGPRPLYSKYLHRYNKHQYRRHEVKPGITGWAQVNGRNAISWEEKFNYDVAYVDKLSFSLDVKIILMTLKKVIQREGINASNAATMEEFRGNG